MIDICTNISNNMLITDDKIKIVFLHSNDALSSSANESIKNILRNIDFEAFKLRISFYQMIFNTVFNHYLIIYY